MKQFVYLLIIFITACGSDIVSDNSTSLNSSGIYAAPFSTKGHIPVTITLYGAGIGKDENYPCKMK